MLSWMITLWNLFKMIFLLSILFMLVKCDSHRLAKERATPLPEPVPVVAVGQVTPPVVVPTSK